MSTPESPVTLSDLKQQVARVHDPDIEVLTIAGRAIFPNHGPRGVRMPGYVGVLVAGKPEVLTEEGGMIEPGFTAYKSGTTFVFNITKREDVPYAFFEAASKFKQLRAKHARRGGIALVKA